MSKICNKCGEDKALDLYGTRNQVKDGKRAVCKECEKKRPVRNFEPPTSGIFACSYCETKKEFTEFYPDKYKKDGRNIYCKPCCSDIKRIYASINPPDYAAISRKRREDPVQKIRMNLGTRLWQVVTKKHGNTMDLTGCSITFRPPNISNWH